MSHVEHGGDGVDPVEKSGITEGFSQVVAFIVMIPPLASVMFAHPHVTQAQMENLHQAVRKSSHGGGH